MESEQHEPNCMINTRCAVYHSDGICPGPYGKCNCRKTNYLDSRTPEERANEPESITTTSEPKENWENTLHVIRKDGKIIQIIIAGKEYVPRSD